MQRFLKPIAVTFFAGLHLGPVLALGFGETVGAVPLGRPLSFVVPLQLDPDNASLEPQCVGADVVVGERPLHPENVRAVLERRASGEYQVRVTTRQSVDEPVVSLTLRIGCPPRLTREFTVFADPPTLLAQAGPSEDVAEARPVRPQSLVSSLDADTTTSQGARTEKKALRPRKETGRTPTRTTRAAVANAASPVSAASGPRASAKKRAVAASTARPREPVLRLDTLEPRTAVAPVTAAVAAAAAASEVDLAQLAALEETVKQLLVEHKARQAALVEIKARSLEAQALQAANDKKPDGGAWLIVMSVMCGVLTVAVAALVWLRHRDRKRAGWWSGPSSMMFPPGGDPASSDEDASAVPSGSVGGGSSLVAADLPRLDSPVLAYASVPPAPEPRPAVSAEIDLPAPADESAEERARVAGFAPTSTPSLDLERPVTADEMIDLEQQVEFFAVLGQDEAAIDLLMEHVRNTGGANPLPYLKLLEIYRRRQERQPHDRIRERFNRRFNAYAPDWEGDPDRGQTLEAYPESFARLQKSWQSPATAVSTLESMLFKRDAGPTFDIPAYRELLFLYGTARELAKADESPSVDLLLPMDEGTQSAMPLSTPRAAHASDVLLSLDGAPQAATDRPAASALGKAPDNALEFKLED